MQSFATILLIYVATLITLPVMTGTSCSSCCERCTQRDHESKKDSKMCNPFEKCTNCVAPILPEHITVKVSLFFSNLEKLHWMKELISNFEYSFFHPPNSWRFEKSEWYQNKNNKENQMKKIIIGICAIGILTSAAIYANSSNNSKNEPCGANCTSSSCQSCPCTPDCQPGDDHCTCPQGCTSKW